MGEFDYEGDVKVKGGLRDGQRMTEEIGRIGEAASHGKGRTGDHGEGRDEGTRDRKGLWAITWLVTALPGRPE